MGSDWQEVALGEIFNVKHGFAFKSEWFTDEPQPTILVTPGNFSIGGGFQNIKPKYYKGQIPKDYVLKPGQIIVTMTDLSKQADTLGYSAIVPDDGNIWLHNQRIGLLEFNESFSSDPIFINYLLRTYNYRSWIIGSASGTTVKHTSPSRIHSFKCKIPPLPEQRAIAHILGSLDDKIELNRQMNQTLEEIGQTIFRHWFVHFEFPDENGQPYKSTGGEMVDSELGEIPAGWKIGRIKDLGKVVCGKTPPKSKQEYFNGEIPFIKIPDMHNQTFVINTEDSLSQEGKKFQENKTLPTNSVCVSCIATVGLVSITHRNSQTNQQINSIIPKNDYLTPYLYYKLISMKEFIKILASGGSATLNLNTKNFSNINILIPDKTVLKSYHDIIQPLFENILNNSLENENLSQIRDSLLPKLMSGKIRVPVEGSAK